MRSSAQVSAVFGVVSLEDLGPARRYGTLENVNMAGQSGSAVTSDAIDHAHLHASQDFIEVVASVGKSSRPSH